MKSSTKQLSKSSSIHENQKAVRIPDERIETGLYFSKGDIAAVFSYENDDPKVVQAFDGNEDFEIMFSSDTGIDVCSMNFSNGLTYDVFLHLNQLKSEFTPDISQWELGFRMPYEIIWIDSTTNKILKNKLGLLSPENTEHLRLFFAIRLICKDIFFNTHFVKFEAA